MISNSTPLICLAKIGRIDVLRKVFGKVVIPRQVLEEVLTEGKEGSREINECVEEGWIEVARVRSKKDYGVDKGENAVINLALELKDEVLIDDAKAIRVLRVLGLNYFRITSLVLLALKKGVLEKGEAKEIIYDLVSNGYWLSSSFLARIIGAIEKF
ncbi:MAG: hypothetical protein KJ592_03320 [Nanoarchaeota archaeon]|nr:hypothetical protein [Nanoarchaeota archaeon]